MVLLIVDDNSIAVRGLNESIQWSDYGVSQVYVAYDASRAYEIVKSCEIDIVLCDIEMPRQNGIELIRRIRNEHIDVDIIFLTCHSKFEFAQQAIQLGCDNYLLRPLPFEEIAQTVKNCVEKRKEQHHSRELQEFGEQWMHTQVEEAKRKQQRFMPQEIVAEAVEYIFENISNEELSVSLVAKQCCLNSDYLNRLFKQFKGISIRRFIIDHRMTMAARMLESQQLPAMVVAEKVGYRNYPYFSTQFKKKYGCMPSEYKIVHTQN